MKRLLILLVFSISSITGFAQQNVLFPDDSFNNNEHWLFNINTDSTLGRWSYASQLPVSLCASASCYIPSKNKILICGGLNSSIIPQRSCYFYDPVNNTYSAADSLPIGRAFGKLLLLKDSLYLIGSIGPNFNSPDGALYKYSLDSNKWQARTNTPAPYLQEMACAVWNDSLIVTVGGSTSGFSGITGSVRIYNPFTNAWKVLFSQFSVPITSAHAEYSGNDLVVCGGFSYTPVNKVYHSVFNPKVDTSVTWIELGLSPFGTSIYRVAGGKWANYMIFGPALHDTLAIPQIWGLSIKDTTWKRFLPNMPDSVSNITSLSVIPNSDSAYFYIFGGILNNTSFTNKASKYAFANPYIGITGNSGKIPSGYKLYQNYPNPFNPSTIIKFDIPNSGFVTLKVFDILGREAAVIVNEYKIKGTYEVIFDGSALASGVYYYTLTTDKKIFSNKMILIK